MHSTATCAILWHELLLLLLLLLLLKWLHMLMIRLLLAIELWTLLELVELLLLLVRSHWTLRHVTARMMVASELLCIEHMGLRIGLCLIELLTDLIVMRSCGKLLVS